MDFKPPLQCGTMIRARCWPTAHELTVALASELAKAAGDPATGAIMLAGGVTPLAAYATLARRPPVVDDGLTLLFSDDRLVPPDQPQSNYRQTRPLLEAWQRTGSKVMRVRGEDPLDQAVQAYDQALGNYLARGGRIGLGLLGLGADGHTASLFTPGHISEGQDRWALGVQRPDGLSGVSVTPRFLKEVKRLIFVVSGSGKKNMAARLLQQPPNIPASMAVQGHRGVELWTDQDAWPF